MNTLNIEAKLASKYKYKPLNANLSEKYRGFYKDNIPQWLNIDGGGHPLFTKNHTKICTEYNRVVVGDYGAFVEINPNSICSGIAVKKGQEYRINDERYSKNVKYLWMTIEDGSDIKIYLQKKTVSYADYVPGKYYISVHECELN